jgi:hypothetical protein
MAKIQKNHLRNRKLGDSAKQESYLVLLSRIGHWYLALFAVFSIVSLAIYIYGVTDLYSTWSFRIEDPPWLPPNFTVSNVMGRHTFGDFQLPYYLAKDANAYSWTFYNATMPFGLFVYKLLNMFSIQIATFVFLTLSTLYFWKTIAKSYSSEKSNLRSYIATVLCLFSLPTLINLDRGGGQMFAYSLFVHGLILLTYDKSKQGEKRKHAFSNFYSIAVLSLAISLKIYLVVPLLLILGRKYLPSIIRTFGFILFTNFLFSFLFGGPFAALKGLYAGYIWQTGESDPGWVFGGVSLSKFIASIYFHTHTQNQTNEFASSFQNYVFIPGLLYLVIVAIIVFSMKENDKANYRIALSLTTIFLIVPVSHSYTLVVCSFVAAFSLRSFFEAHGSAIKWKSAILLITASLSLLPIPNEHYLTLIPAFWLVHLGALLILNILSHKTIKRIGRKSKATTY